MKILTALLLSLTLLVPMRADAVALISFPFGGRIVFQFFCTCEIPGTSILYISGGSKKYLSAKFIPYFSTLYEKYTPYMGANVLGRYTTIPGQQCSYIAGNSCSSFPVLNKIQMIGTSFPSFGF